MGGSSYIDAVMLRDRDTDATPGGGSLNERVSTLQNWRADVVAAPGKPREAVDPAGEIIERARSNPYGQPVGCAPGDDDLSGGMIAPRSPQGGKARWHDGSSWCHPATAFSLESWHPGSSEPDTATRATIVNSRIVAYRETSHCI